MPGFTPVITTPTISQVLAYASGTEWKNVTHELHVTDFGATGNGTADDTAAFIRWADAAQEITTGGEPPAWSSTCHPSTTRLGAPSAQH